MLLKINHKILFILLIKFIFLTNKSYAFKTNIPNEIMPYVSIKIQNINNNKLVYSLNADTPRLIASNVKLFTTYFALQELGTDFKWETKLYYSGYIKKKVLKGNLYIVGGGDPTLDEKSIYEILSALKSNNIDKIQGNVIIDESIFNQIPQYSFLQTNPYDTDTTLPSGLMINEEKTLVTLDTSTNNIKIISNLYGFKLINNLKLNDLESNCTRIYNKIKVTKINDKIILNGEVPLGCKNKQLEYKFLSNFAYNRTIIYKVFDYLNIKIEGDVVSGNLDKDTSKIIYTHHSSNLENILITMNKFSNNLIAETLLMSFGAYNSTNKHTYLEAIQKYNKFLSNNGYLLKKTKIENGAGLSRYEFFTTNDITNLLTSVYFSKDASNFMVTLPTPLEDGSLKKRFSRFKNNLYAKTGTLNDVIAISGYFKNNFGNVYVFSIIFNNVDDYRKEQILNIDNMIEYIFDQL